MVTTTCAFCGIKFNVSFYRISRSKNLFCSKDCKKRYQKGRPNLAKRRRVMVRCEQCGQEFERTLYKSEINKRNFCSVDCYNTWQAENPLTGQDSPNYKSVTTKCAYCGSEVIQPPSQIQNNKRHFCNHACKAAWQGIHQVGGKNPAYKGGPTLVECATCGKTLERGNGKLKRNNLFFCDHVCYGQWRSQNTAGENSPTWKGGTVDYYGPNWRRQRNSARKRDNYTCKYCGITEAELGREMDVHHIAPFRSFGYIPEKNDHYKSANKLDNLVCLCPLHHRALEHGSISLP